MVFRTITNIYLAGSGNGKEMDEENMVEIGEGEVGIFPIDTNGNRIGKPFFQVTLVLHRLMLIGRKRWLGRATRIT